MRGPRYRVLPPLPAAELEALRRATRDLERRDRRALVGRTRALRWAEWLDHAAPRFAGIPDNAASPVAPGDGE